MKVSIIIPTLNEEGYIEDCLASISRQTYRDYEVIVVDSGDDKTANIAKGFGAKVLKNKRARPATARNIGAKRACGEILVFADADVRFESDFLIDVVKKFRRKTIGGAICKLSVYDAKKRGYKIIYNFINRFAWLMIKCGAIVTSGSCFVYRKEFFDAVGGFDERLLTAEDHDLARKVSKLTKFDAFNDINVLTSSRRLNRKGVLRGVSMILKSTLLYLTKHRGYPEYWA